MKKLAISTHVCVYHKCPNNDRSNRELAFFSFPISDTKRVEEWKRNCGNAEIAQMDNKTLKGKLICEKHFAPKYICRNPMRKLLTKTAIPKRFDDNDETGESVGLLLDGRYLAVGQHSKIYGKKRVLSEPETHIDQVRPLYIDIDKNGENIIVSNEPKQITSIAKENENILNEQSPLENLPEKELETLASKPAHCKKKNTKCTVNCKRNINKSSLKALLMNATRHRSKFVRTFVKMQVFHEKNSKWTKAERDLVLSLYLKSPSAYKFMLYDLRFILPSEEVVQDWLKLRRLNPGLNCKLIRKLSIKAKTMSEQEKIVAVLFEEIKLKPQLEFDALRDRIEGYENLDNRRKSSSVADTALIFSVSSLLYNWKIPFSYYTSSGCVNSVTLQRIVSDVIRQLKTITFNPQVLICNQELNKFGMLELLGATQENPTIQVHDQKIFTCFDTSHLLADLRTNFVNPKLQFVVDKSPISCTDVTNVYDIDSMSDEQVFCGTVAAVIRSSSVAQNSTTTVEHTAQFLEKISYIVEALKYRILHTPLNKNHESVIDVLHMAAEYLKRIEIFENGKLRTGITCIKGFQWTVNSVLRLWNHFKGIGVKYLLTSCLNFDNHGYFSSAAKDTVKSLRVKMQDNIKVEMQREVKHFEFEDSHNLAEDNEESEERRESGDEATDTCVNDELGQRVKKAIPNDRVTLSASSTEYLAGYLAHQVIEKYKCVNCVINLQSDHQRLIDRDELLNLSKDYCCDVNDIRYLQKPYQSFVYMTLTLLRSFSGPYNNFKSGEDISKNVLDFYRKYLQKCPNWMHLQMSGYCTEHMEFVLKLFIKMNILKCAREESEIYRRSSELIKPFIKIRVLQAELL